MSNFADVKGAVRAERAWLMHCLHEHIHCRINLEGSYNRFAILFEGRTPEIYG